MNFHKKVLRLFRSWAILTHPETDLDLLIEEFENEYHHFKGFYNQFFDQFPDELKGNKN